MTTTNAYDVIFHYEIGGKHSSNQEHIQVAASASDYNTLLTAIQNNTLYKGGKGTLVIDSVKNIGGGTLQQ